MRHSSLCPSAQSLALPAHQVISKIYAPRPLSAPGGVFSEPGGGGSTAHAEIVAALGHYFAGQASGNGSSDVMKKVT